MSYKLLTDHYALINTILVFLFYRVSVEFKQYKEVLLISWLLYAVIILINSVPNSMRLLKSHYSDSYQLIGNTFSIISIFFIRNKWLKLVLFTLVLILLFLIKSRGTFFSFTVVYMVWIMLEIGFKKWFYIFLVFVAMLVISLYIDLFSIDKRMLGIFLGLKDPSLVARYELLIHGLEAIKNNWLLENYAGQIIPFNSQYTSGIMGAYIHNFLSFWRQFGFLFFIVFMVLFMYGMFRNYNFLRIESSNQNQFIFYVSLFLFCEMLFSRSYILPYFWFSLALMFTNIVQFGKIKKV